MKSLDALQVQRDVNKAIVGIGRSCPTDEPSKPRG
jgi:hypothetical protein